MVLSVINLLSDFYLCLPQFLPCKIVINDYHSHPCCWRKLAKVEFIDVQLNSSLASQLEGCVHIAMFLGPQFPHNVITVR